MTSINMKAYLSELGISIDKFETNWMIALENSIDDEIDNIVLNYHQVIENNLFEYLRFKKDFDGNKYWYLSKEVYTDFEVRDLVNSMNSIFGNDNQGKTKFSKVDLMMWKELDNNDFRLWSSNNISVQLSFLRTDDADMLFMNVRKIV